VARWKHKTGREPKQWDRRSFAAPPRTGESDGIDLALLDPADADDRHLLILAEHPELATAIERGEEGIVVGGQPMSPQLHVTTHEVVANQLWDDDPPEVWQTAQRLLAAGYRRHAILHMLGSVFSRSAWHALQGEEYDRERYVRALEALPESWYELADESD
jgi:hypothetical protein